MTVSNVPNSTSHQTVKNNTQKFATTKTSSAIKGNPNLQTKQSIDYSSGPQISSKAYPGGQTTQSSSSQMKKYKE